jgi:hypothetical protein
MYRHASKSFLTITLVVLVLSCLMPAASKAAFEFRIYEKATGTYVVSNGAGGWTTSTTNSAYQTISSGTNVATTVDGKTVNLTFAITSDTNAAGTLNVSGTITGNSGSTDNFYIEVFDTSMTTSITSRRVTSSIDSLNDPNQNGHPVTYTIQGFADPNNGAFNATQGTIPLTAGTTLTPSTAKGTNAPSFTDNVPPTFPFNSSTANFSGINTSNGYSLYGILNIAMTDKQGGFASISFSVNSVQGVPVPASVVLVVSAFPALGLGHFLRRRKDRQAA